MELSNSFNFLNIFQYNIPNKLSWSTLFITKLALWWPQDHLGLEATLLTVYTTFKYFLLAQMKVPPPTKPHVILLITPWNEWPRFLLSSQWGGSRFVLLFYGAFFLGLYHFSSCVLCFLINCPRSYLN